MTRPLLPQSNTVLKSSATNPSNDHCIREITISHEYTPFGRSRGPNPTLPRMRSPSACGVTVSEESALLAPVKSCWATRLNHSSLFLPSPWRAHWMSFPRRESKAYTGRFYERVKYEKYPDRAAVPSASIQRTLPYVE